MTLVIGCVFFLVRRIQEYSHYMVKPLWVAETAIYIVLIIAFLLRTDPVDRSRGIAQIAIPALGALLPFALLLTSPARWIMGNQIFLLGVLWVMTLATALTVWGMWSLRRSFSITVEARSLVIGGPYRWIRHPIYLGEMLAAAAVTVWRFSWVSVSVLVLFVVLQLVRARMEEEKLVRNFPAYKEYAGKVWWIWKRSL
jgi:protein-S-isoprenylcysteine O-methyltransferase Ste14